jgi:hypothetical protein
MSKKANVDKTTLCWTIRNLPDRSPNLKEWKEAAKSVSDHEFRNLWHALNSGQRSDGSRAEYWEPEILNIAIAPFPAVKVRSVPAIRKIGQKGSESDEFDGVGLIERLARIERPGALEQHKKSGFNAIS